MGMTEQETLELGKKLYENITKHGSNNIIHTKDYIEYVEKSNKALEEVQQYRALGTVEELKHLKQINEDCLIKHLTGIECSYNETGCSDCIGKQALLEAMGKQIAKKPVKRSFIVPYEGIDVCPSCKEPLVKKEHHCKCGQKLDWGNEDAE